LPRAKLDPKAPENTVIVDLDKAPRNVRGMVEYEVDIFILRPADAAKGNGILSMTGLKNPTLARAATKSWPRRCYVFDVRAACLRGNWVSLLLPRLSTS